MSNKYCLWQETDEGFWETDCGHAYVVEHGTPSEEEMKFCCFCGLKLDESRLDDND